MCLCSYMPPYSSFDAMQYTCNSICGSHYYNAAEHVWYLLLLFFYLQSFWVCTYGLHTHTHTFLRHLKVYHAHSFIARSSHLHLIIIFIFVFCFFLFVFFLIYYFSSVKHSTLVWRYYALIAIIDTQKYTHTHTTSSFVGFVYALYIMLRVLCRYSGHSHSWISEISNYFVRAAILKCVRCDWCAVVVFFLLKTS